MTDRHPFGEAADKEIRINPRPDAAVDADLGQQKASAETFRHAVKTANDVQDYASRDLANEILKAKEDRIDQIETEIEQFEAMGREVYLSTRV